MEHKIKSISDYLPKPLAIGWIGGKDRNNGITINFSRRFNWLQRWAIRTLCAIEIENVMEDKTS